MTKQDWIECTFSEVLQIVSGKNQRKVENPNGEYPIYGSGGIIGRANEYLCEPHTTIIGRKGTINTPIYVKEKFWNVDTAFGFHPFSILDSRLLYFFCIYFNFKSLDKSTTIPSLAKRDLLQIKLKLPPLVEQHAIVKKIETLFSSLDSGIADLKKAQDQLKIYRQAVLKKAFDGELTKEWREKNKVIFDWEKLTFKDVLEIVSGKNQKQVENPNGKFPIYGSGGKFGNADKYLCEAGTTIIGRKGTINSPIFVNEKFWNVDTAFGLSPFDCLNNLFLYYFCLGFNFKRLDKSTTIPSLAKRDLLKIQINVPSLKEQHQIVRDIESRLSVCDAVEQNIADSLEKAQALRQSILKKAFEGKLLSEEEIAQCRQHVAYEPASVLVERIKAEKKLK